MQLQTHFAGVPALRTFMLAGLLGATALLTGCATSRSEVKLGAFDADKSAYAVTKTTPVLIRSVTDERTFEDSPKNPSTPSLGEGGASKASDDVRARAIGRKRNTYGMALGDVLLENGQTVAGVVRENLTFALRQAGYRVTTHTGEAGPSPVVIEARIKKFWAWVQPGFWALTFHADITTDLEISGIATPTIVTVNTEDSRQLATDSAWIGIVDQALRDYRSQVAVKYDKLPTP
jgi:hypothetical protein